MPSLPDPDLLVALAERIATHAALARREAHRVAAAAGAITWSGVAASAFDEQAAEIVWSMRRSAERLDDAADALRRHAATVAQVVDTLVRLGHDALDLATALAHGALDDLLHPAAAVGGAAAAIGDAAHVTGDVLGGAAHVSGGLGRLVGIG